MSTASFFRGPSRFGAFAMTILWLVVGQARAQVIYSEDFSSGSPLESLTDSHFGFSAQMGDMRLGAAEYGASGLAVNGALATAGVDNELYKLIDMGSHGLIQFSADIYVPSGDFSGVGLRLLSGALVDPNHFEFSLGSAGYFSDWESSTYPAPRNTWDSPSGMHDDWVHASLFWNQDTGENWATVTDGVDLFASPHNFYPGHVIMAGIGLEEDRRYSNGGSDIRNLRVDGFPTPEPSGLIAAAACLCVYRKKRGRSVRDE